MFYYILELLGSDANMLELMYVLKPNIIKLEKGKDNIKLNNLDISKFIFINGFIGSKYNALDIFVDWDKTKMNIPQYNIEKKLLMRQIYFLILFILIFKVQKLDMLIGFY